MSEKITFSRKTFDEQVAADILDDRPRATREEISVVANRWLRTQYLNYTPDRTKDTFTNFAVFVRRYPNAAKLAFGFLPFSDKAMPHVEVTEDA
jgi:hypothetical protein